MEFEAVKQWYAGHNNREIRQRRLLVILGFTLLPFGTAVGLMLVYVFLYLFKHHADRHPAGLEDAWCVWLTLGIMAAMFIVNAFIPRQRGPEKLYSEEADIDDSLTGHYVQRGVIQVKFFLWFILTGPRLFSWSLYSLDELSRLKKQDIHAGAALLWLMLAKRGKVPYADIPKELDWLDVHATLEQMRSLPGIVFLQNPPPGISMTDELRSAIRNNTPL
jgi:hypothetical protein